MTLSADQAAQHVSAEHDAEQADDEERDAGERVQQARPS
jgi:hypothetical protein